jgi:aspartate aminotransferase-like enzyme
MKKHFLLTPGPTPIPPEVSAREGLPVLHHRTSEFGAIFQEVIENLKYAFQTKNDVFVIASSGTGAMESAVCNLLSPSDTAIVASSGVFGDRFSKIMDVYGIKAVLVREPDGYPVSASKIEEALQKNPSAKAVFATHTETSTGVVNDIAAIGKVVAKSSAILVVDAISGLAGQELRTDAWAIDVVCTGSQKGLMTAPGLAMVSVSSKAWSFVEASKSPRFYFDWRKMKKSVAEKQTPFTPPVTVIAAQAEALRRIKQEGIENVFTRHAWLANATREAVQALGLSLFAKAPCNVLTSITVPAGVDGKAIVKRMREDYGVSIAGGQGDLVGKIIRLAHMGFMERFDVIIGISALEMMLHQLGYKVELGKGVAAAERAFLNQPKAAAPPPLAHV